jgi:predicted RNase H-like HicB family nuclease
MKICIPLNSKSDNLRRWVAKVSYKSTLAFYAIGRTIDEALANIKEKADTHFANLANLKGFQVDLKCINIAEVDINEAFLVDFLVKSSQECKIGNTVPTDILLPLQMTLCPVVDMYDEDPWLCECRGIIAKEEACYLANKGLRGPYSVAKLQEDDDGKLIWDISSRTGDKEHQKIKSTVN